MMFLRVCMTLCSLLALSRTVPVNSTDSHHMGRCHHNKEREHFDPGTFIPECDSDGNYVPQQCCSATGYCWCVNVITGDEIYNTRGLQGNYHYDCIKEYYCPYDWTHFGSRCMVFIDSPKTWIEAEGYCIFEGGNMASVHSHEENHAIQALTRGNTHEFPLTWIGGHDAVQTGSWMWSDGTEFTYKNWYMEYNTNRTEHCLLMNYGHKWKWNYAACNKTLPFVCSKRSYYYR